MVTAEPLLLAAARCSSSDRRIPQFLVVYLVAVLYAVPRCSIRARSSSEMNND